MTSVVSNPSDEAARSEKVRNMGVPGGLFRAAMDEIKQSHTVGQSLRAAFVLSGVFTDKLLYAELLCQFAHVTKVFEGLLMESAAFPDLKGMYSFSSSYEADLRSLVGPEASASLVRGPTLAYADLLLSHSQAPHSRESLLAAAVILWGPLVIGGGAVMAPRVKKSYGPGCVGVFEAVTGPGRADRQRAFVDFVDGAAAGVDKDKVVELCGVYMDHNNRIMAAVERRPKWLRYLGAGAAAAAVAAAAAALPGPMPPV
mmetsp:Transcript_6427/g.12284  ORF Transcript_6427/g.12284 Transcript_6427/m.12284 type:complete len:257 (-) Transcript_6427:500-1270(-)